MRFLDKITAVKIRDGDVRAFESLMNSYKNKVFNYCLRFCGNYYLAEEVTQEVFISVYRNIALFDWRKGSLSTWIYRITHNACVNSTRKSLEAPFDELAATAQFASAEEEYLQKELMNSLNRAIQLLLPEERSLVIMKDYLGFKVKEICEITSLPAGTVKSRLHSIRTKVRTKIGEFKELLSAFKQAFSQDTSTDNAFDYNKSLLVIKNLQKSIIFWSITIVITAVILILSNLADPNELGPSFAVALLTLLYGFGGHSMLLIPMEMSLRKKLLLVNPLDK